MILTRPTGAGEEPKTKARNFSEFRAFLYSSHGNRLREEVRRKFWCSAADSFREIRGEVDWMQHGGRERRCSAASPGFRLFEDRFRPVLQEGENDTGCSKTISLGYGRISLGKAFLTHILCAAGFICLFVNIG